MTMINFSFKKIIPVNKWTIIIPLTLLCITHANAQTSQVRTLYFKNNSHVIEKKYLPLLNDVGQQWTNDTLSFIKIVGYTDTTGVKKYNELLSERRARAVYNYLTKKFRISPLRIYITWLGETTDGAYELHFPEAKVQKRCVDILINFTKHADQ